MEQLDVTTSFLYANLEEEVYLEIPEGMFEEEIPGKVLRLFKALYGLKQSPRMWNLHVAWALRNRPPFTPTIPPGAANALSCGLLIRMNSRRRSFTWLVSTSLYTLVST